MSKWGLLRGAGQGMAQAGNMLMADRIDQMKEQRLQKYQEGLQQKQFEREDTLIANANERDDARHLQDRTDAQTRDAQQLAFNSNVQIQAQKNADRQFDLQSEQQGLSTSLVTRQLDQLDQQIEIGGIELEQVRGRDELRKQILAETDPEKQMQLMGDYASLASDFNVEPKTITVYGEIDEMTGQQTRTTMQWDAAQRKWMPVMGGVAGSNRPSLAELFGESPAGQPVATEGNGQPWSMTNSSGSPASRAEGSATPPDRYSMESVSQERGDTGMGERAAGLLRRITPNLQPDGQIAQIEDRINMIMSRSDEPPISNRQLDDQRLALTRLIQDPGTPEPIKTKARELFDRIR